MQDSRCIRCDQNDIANNYVFVKGILTAYKAKVPSVYFIADVLLLLDKKNEGKLLKPVMPKDKMLTETETTQSKQQLALREAGKLKKVMGYLRYLYRNSQTTAKNKKVRDLKLMLQPRALKTSFEKPAGTTVTSMAAALADVDDMVVALAVADVGDTVVGKDFTNTKTLMVISK